MAFSSPLRLSREDRRHIPPACRVGLNNMQGPAGKLGDKMSCRFRCVSQGGGTVLPVNGINIQSEHDLRARAHSADPVLPDARASGSKHTLKPFDRAESRARQILGPPATG